MLNNKTDNLIFKESENGLIVNVRIIPNSAKNDIIFENQFLKIKITAQPIENKANKALIDFLSKKLKTAKSNIQIIKGELSKQKTILIKNFNKEYFLKLIN